MSNSNTNEKLFHFFGKCAESFLMYRIRVRFYDDVQTVSDKTHQVFGNSHIFVSFQSLDLITVYCIQNSVDSIDYCH